MHKKKEWICLFIIIMAVILVCSSTKSKVVMAQVEPSGETAVMQPTSEGMESTSGGLEPTSEGTESTPELSTWEEPQRSLEEVFDLEKSRVAATGVNRRAPFYIALQLKEEFCDWVVTALNYQSTIQPSESFLVDMNMQQPGLYIGERVTTDEMAAGQWKLQEVWVMSPRRVVFCISRTSQEEAFSKFDFSLVENPVVQETGTEEGSLVERPEAGSQPSQPVNPTSAADPLPAASQPAVPAQTVASQEISSQAENPVLVSQQTMPAEVTSMEQHQVQIAVENSEAAKSAQILAAAKPSQETKQSELETEEETTESEKQSTKQWKEQESLENTEAKTNVQNEWSFWVLIVVFAGAGIVLIYIQNRKQ